jgi:hypothetical protein
MAKVQSTKRTRGDPQFFIYINRRKLAEAGLSAGDEVEVDVSAPNTLTIRKVLVGGRVQ